MASIYDLAYEFVSIYHNIYMNTVYVEGVNLSKLLMYVDRGRVQATMRGNFILNFHVMIPCCDNFLTLKNAYIKVYMLE